MKIQTSCVLLIALAGVLLLGARAEAQQTNIVVPNVEGISQDVATQILRHVGLQPRVQRKVNQTAMITHQDPRPGTLVAAGTEVVISTAMLSQRSTDVTTSRGFPTAGAVTLAAPPASATILTTPSAAPQTTQATATVVQSTSRHTVFDVLARVFPEPQMYPVWYPQAFRRTSTGVSTTGSSSTFTSEPSTKILGVPLYPVKTQQTSAFVPSADSAWSTISGSSTQSSATGPHTYYLQRSDSVTTTFSAAASNNSGTVAVPPLLRLSQRDAETAIQHVGLQVGTVARVASYDAPSGRVLQQMPRSGQFVPAGTRVDLWIVE